MTYSEKLKDPRWIALSARLVRQQLCLCNDCGEHFPGGKGLECHHCWYEFNKDPWDYPDECFLVLCRRCHGKRQKVENSTHVALGMLTRLLSVEEVMALAFEIVAKRGDIERPVDFSL